MVAEVLEVVAAVSGVVVAGAKGISGVIPKNGDPRVRRREQQVKRELGRSFHSVRGAAQK